MLFVIRTKGSPLKSRPSLPLLVTTAAIVTLGIDLPFSPVARFLGFAPLPAPYFVFLVVATGCYLAAVQIAKRWLLGNVFVRPLVSPRAGSTPVVAPPLDRSPPRRQ